MSASRRSRSTTDGSDAVERVAAALEKECQLERKLAAARRAVREALVGARASGATYRILATRIAPPTGDRAGRGVPASPALTVTQSVEVRGPTHRASSA